MKRTKEETFKEFRKAVSLLIDKMDIMSAEDFERYNGGLDVLWRTLERLIRISRQDFERSQLHKLKETNDER